MGENYPEVKLNGRSKLPACQERVDKDKVCECVNVCCQLLKELCAEEDFLLFYTLSNLDIYLMLLYTRMRWEGFKFVCMCVRMA